MRRFLTCLAAGGAITACGQALPPRQVLESGCHVWWEKKDGEKGIAVRVERGQVHVLKGEEERDGPRIASDFAIYDHEKRVAKLYANGVLQSTEAEWQAELRGETQRITWREIGGDEKLVLWRSRACPMGDAAAGAVALFRIVADQRRRAAPPPPMPPPFVPPPPPPAGF